MNIRNNISMQNIQKYQDNYKAQDTKAAQSDTRLDTRAERERIIRESKQNATQKNTAKQFGRGQSVDYKA